MDIAKSCPMAFFTPIVEIAEATNKLLTETKEIIPKLEELDSDEVKVKLENDEKNNSNFLVGTSPHIDSDEVKVKHDNDGKNNGNFLVGTSPHIDFVDVKVKLENDENNINFLVETSYAEIPFINIKTENEVKQEPKQEIIDDIPNTNKRKRGKTNKYDARSEKKRECKTKVEYSQTKRKQRVSKKNHVERDDISYEEETLISMDHLDETKVIKCPTCKDDKDWTLTEIKQHYKAEHPKKRLRTSRFFGDMHPCDICGKEFKSSGSLKDHMERHNNYFYCDICNHSTKKILDHIVHLKIHSHMGFFQCLMCEFSTLEIKHINDHVTHHADLLKYWCNSCQKSFQILQHFQEHDNYHTGLKPFDCQFCGKCFLYSRYLHAHKMIMHKEEVQCPNTYECVICNKVYQRRNSLKLHMNSHTGNFAICDVCGKTLSSKEKLKFHLRIHTGYKPYSCHYCGKCFTKKVMLVEHIRVHTGEKPYVCDYCTKAFTQKCSLLIHVRGHTGEKPYSCQFCFKAFVAKAMLNIHLRTCKSS